MTEPELAGSFQFYKGVGIAASLFLMVSFQLLLPNRLSLGTLVHNWKVNAPLALVDAALLSFLCGACVCSWAVTVREHGVGVLGATSGPYWLQVAAAVVTLDLVAFAWHRANHRWPFLWRFHAVHHSDVHLDASTAFRFHPGELLISLGVRLVVITITGLPILGLIGFEVVYGFCNLFVHSDIRLDRTRERQLGLVFVTPSLHRLHHSERPAIHNTNFGTIFSLWDRLSGTLRRGHAATPVTLGLPGQHGRPLSVWGALFRPLRRGINHPSPE